MKRKRRRRISYRPAGRRPMQLLRGALACVAIVALALSAGVIVRSLRTAHTNRALAALHTVDGERPAAEVAAPPMAAATGVGRAPQRSYGSFTLSRMGLPDGSPIETLVQSHEPAGYHKTSGDVLPDMMKLLRSNPDTVGWISIPGIVHLPVVYRDNAYYLTHDFNGHRNTSGTLFLDQDSPITEQTQNLLIHGHSMYDGSMFGLLTHYQKRDTLVKHPLISFSTLYEKETYVVFAVLVQDPKAFDYYSHPFFASNAEFESYVASACAHSLYDIPVDVKPSDPLLTLSTCIDDDRLVVLARKMRANETRDELVSAVEQSDAV